MAGDFRYSIFSVQDHYPNRNRTIPQLYNQIIEQAETAETLGYNTFYVAEHHFHEYGAVPNPSVMLSSIAQRTTRLRLGSAISILTFHHPLTVAESYAMVDVLSEGRMALGVGSGYLKHEFEGYNVNPADKRELFDEGLDIVSKALTGDRFSYKGKYYTVDDVQLNVVPVQKGGIPIYVAVLRKEAAYFMGLKGHKIISIPYASVDKYEDIEGFVTEYRRGQKDAGITGTKDDIILAFHTHVGDNDAEVRRIAEDPFDLYVATRLYAKSQTYNDIMASRLSLFGTADNVADRIKKYQEMGIHHIMTLQNFGLMAQSDVLRSMKNFAENVVPQLG